MTRPPEDAATLKWLHKVVDEDDIDSLWILLGVPHIRSLVAQTNEVLAHAIYRGDSEIVELLLSLSGDLNSGNYSVLVAAVDSGSDGLVEVLVNYGADVNLAIGDDPPPLVSAIHMGNRFAVQSLISLGAKVDVLYEGRSLLDQCFEEKDFRLVPLLIEHGVNLVYYHNNPEAVKWIDSKRNDKS